MLRWMQRSYLATQPGADLVEHTAGVGGAVDGAGLLVVRMGPPRRP
jgi:hypothetical protein